MKMKQWLSLFVLICMIAFAITPVQKILHAHARQAAEPVFDYSDALMPPDLPSRPFGNLSASQSPRPSYNETSEYLIGSVAVGIILLESNGTIDPPTEDWTSIRESLVVSEIRNSGLSWLASYNPNAKVGFVYDIHYQVPTSYEPINHPYWYQGYWIDEAMTYLGYPGTSYFTQVRDYINDLRDTLGTDWAFTIFVVDSYNDWDGRFTDDYSAYAYLGGPFLVMTYDNGEYGIGNMDFVTAHETCHIFYATDEYDGVTETSGYLGVEDHEGSGCMMDVALAWWLCTNSREQLGWRDSDGDGIQDIVDTFPETVLNPYSPDPTYETVLTYTGNVAVTPFPNNNPHGWGRDITINTITNVEFRVDGSSWLSAVPSDGTFEEAEEYFEFSTFALAAGNHTIEARGINSVGNVETTCAIDQIVILLSRTFGWVAGRGVCDESFSSSERRPSMATDSDGNLYVAYEHYSSTSGYYEIYVSKSMDDGDSWSIIGGVTDLHNLAFPSIAVDVGDNNNIFVAFEREWTPTDHDIFVLKCIDGSWSVSSVANTIGSDDRYPSITSERQYGTADRQYISYEYVYSSNDRDLMFAKSQDDGGSWSVRKLHGGWPDGNVHCQTSITTTRDSDGSDYIYIAYKWGADYTAAYDIVIDKSNNRGDTWTQQWVCDETSRDKSWPSITATQGGDTVVVAWHVYWDSTYLNDVQYAYSTNNGDSWNLSWLALEADVNEETPTLTVDVDAIHAAYWRDNDVYYRKTNPSSPWLWTPAELVTDTASYVSSDYTRLAITTYRDVEGYILPAVAWTNWNGSSYGIYYSTKALIGIYIRADGRVEPDTAPISSVDNVTYTFTDNIHDEIMIERSNIVVDGMGHTLDGTQGSGVGFHLSGVTNVTIRNTNIQDFEYGIRLSSSSGNLFFHNNLVNNTQQVYSYNSTNFWDDGYPPGGNYWGDYAERYPSVGDVYHGATQLMPGSDGVWDSPYEIDVENQDNYPLVEPWSEPKPAGDVDRDGDVDIYDLHTASKAYRYWSDELEYNRHADINKDGIVDTGDIEVIAQNYGKPNP